MTGTVYHRIRESQRTYRPRIGQSTGATGNDFFKTKQVAVDQQDLETEDKISQPGLVDMEVSLCAFAGSSVAPASPSTLPRPHASIQSGARPNTDLRSGSGSSNWRRTSESRTSRISRGGY